MKLQTITIKDLDDIRDELKEVLARMGTSLFLEDIELELETPINNPEDQNRPSTLH